MSSENFAISTNLKYLLYQEPHVNQPHVSSIESHRFYFLMFSSTGFLGHLPKIQKKACKTVKISKESEIRFVRF